MKIPTVRAASFPLPHRANAAWSCGERRPFHFRKKLLAVAVLMLGGMLTHGAAFAQAASPLGANSAGVEPIASPAAVVGQPGTRGGTTSSATASMSSPNLGAASPLPCNWPLFSKFISTNIQADGRVIDYGPPIQTTSEGQSYGMFFALVNNDRVTFDRIFKWSQANLAKGDLTKQLPAWRWGMRADGNYGVLDPNSASDSDLWLAYDLVEAGRLWGDAQYASVGRAMLVLIANREVFDLPGLGPLLAPGQTGFALAGDVWRLNPSYMPLPLLRVAAQVDPSGPWSRIATNSVKMTLAISPRGFAPDWTGYQTGKGFIIDPVNGALGSYDAIRVYLWAGLTSHADPLSKSLLGALTGMQSVVAKGAPVPEKVDTLSGGTNGNGPVGFAASLLPYLQAYNATASFNATKLSIAHMLTTAKPGYYNGVLALFGQGSAEGRYKFSARGRLIPDWSNSCSAGSRG